MSSSRREMRSCVAVGNAGAVAGGDDGAVVDLDRRAQVGRDAVAFVLLAAGLLNSALAGSLLLGLDALLLKARIAYAHAPHELTQPPQTIFIDGIVGDDGSGIDPDEAVTMVVVALDGIDGTLGIGADGDAEIGERDIVLRLGVEMGDDG